MTFYINSSATTVKIADIEKIVHDRVNGYYGILMNNKDLVQLTFDEAMDLYRQFGIRIESR